MGKKYLPAIIIAPFFFLAPSADLGSKTMTAMQTVQVPGTRSPVALDVYLPGKKISSALIVLPGWKFSRERWHRETRLLDYCKKNNMAAFFPEMGITVYESRYFPETTIRWTETPGGAWIRDILIPYIRKEYGLMKQGQKNFLLGLSTGGRGVVLVSRQNPRLFSGGAALSGDFNQLTMPGDALMTGVYGSQQIFPERWRDIDNPEETVSRGNCPIPLYIGHGRADAIVPFSQSEAFHQAIRRHCPGTPVTFNGATGMGHDFVYWDSELEAVFAFFDIMMRR